MWPLISCLLGVISVAKLPAVSGSLKNAICYFLINPLVMVEIPAFIRIHFESWHPELTGLVRKLTICSSGAQAVLLTLPELISTRSLSGTMW